MPECYIISSCNQASKTYGLAALCQAGRRGHGQVFGGWDGSLPGSYVVLGLCMGLILLLFLRNPPTSSLTVRLSLASVGLTWVPRHGCLVPGSAGQGHLGHPLTRFQPAGRGTQSASRRVGRTSSARAALLGCSRRPGLRETRGTSATSGQGPPPPPRAPHADWLPPTCPRGWVDPEGLAALGPGRARAGTSLPGLP